MYAYFDETVAVIEDAGWELWEDCREDGYLVYKLPFRDEYRLTFVNWDIEDDRSLEDCDITIDEFNSPRAVYLHMKPAGEPYPVDAVAEELAVFAAHYL